jgi:hypothetical protein
LGSMPNDVAIRLSARTEMGSSESTNGDLASARSPLALVPR